MQILKMQNKQSCIYKVTDKLSKEFGSEFPDIKGFSSQNLKYIQKSAEEYKVDEVKIARSNV
jgi:hypothetical protein